MAELKAVPKTLDRQQRRIGFVAVLMLMWLLLLFFRTAQIMVFQPELFLQKQVSCEKWVEKMVPAKRGALLAPDGTPLAWSEMRFDLVWDWTGRYREKVLPIFTAELENLSIPPVGQEVGWLLKRNLTLPEVQKVAELMTDYRELVIRKYWIRRYRGLVSNELPGDKMQQLENKYHQFLRGQNGLSRCQVREDGYPLRKTTQWLRPVKDGVDVTVTEFDLK